MNGYDTSYLFDEDRYNNTGVLDWSEDYIEYSEDHNE